LQKLSFSNLSWCCERVRGLACSGFAISYCDGKPIWKNGCYDAERWFTDMVDGLGFWDWMKGWFTVSVFWQAIKLCLLPKCRKPNS